MHQLGLTNVQSLVPVSTACIEYCMRCPSDLVTKINFPNHFFHRFWVEAAAEHQPPQPADPLAL